MKCFVTDAQLAAWRVEIAATLSTQMQARHEAEILRLREDRDEIVARMIAEAGHVQLQHDTEMQRLLEHRRDELTRLADPQAPFVAHLQAEVAFWRMQFAHERQRAEISIDQRLSEQGRGIVTLPLRPEAPPEAAAAQTTLLDELMKNVEFAAMGSAEGVPT